MKRFICCTVFAALAFAGPSAFAADDCTKITATGHPEYPVIAFKEGDNIAGAAPDLVAAIAKKLNVPLQSKDMGSWEEAQEATRDGKADLIVGVYYNDARAGYLDYVQPAFMYDDVAVFVAKGKKFPFKGKDDLIGKKGVTSKGESYGNDFDAFMKDKLDVSRTKGIGLPDRRISSRRRRGGRQGAEGSGRRARSGLAHGGDVRRLLEEVAVPLISRRLRSRHHHADHRWQLRQDADRRDSGVGQDPAIGGPYRRRPHSRLDA
jgi:hypothetical protein